MEKLEPDEAEEDAVNEKKKKKEKKRKKKKEKEVEQIVLEMRDSSEKESDAEEVDFWMPPVGERWDFDDGGDRWGTDSESGEENGEEDGIGEFGFHAYNYFIHEEESIFWLLVFLILPLQWI